MFLMCSKVVVLLFLVLVFKISNADVVGISPGIGNGFIFGASGKCLILLPQHVRKRLSDTPENSIDFYREGQSGRASHLWASDEKDIALMSVDNMLGTNANCTTRSWSDLETLNLEALTTRALAGNKAKLLFIDGNGALLNQDVTDISRSRLGQDFLSGKVRNAFPGLSGSTLYINDQVFGMTLKADEEPDDEGNTIIDFSRFDVIRAAIKPEIEKLPPLLPPTTPSSLTPKTPPNSPLVASAKKYWWIPVVGAVVYALTRPSTPDPTTPVSIDVPPFPIPE